MILQAEDEAQRVREEAALRTREAKARESKAVLARTVRLIPPSLVSQLRLVRGTGVFLGLGFQNLMFDGKTAKTDILAHFSPIIKDSSKGS